MQAIRYRAWPPPRGNRRNLRRRLICAVPCAAILATIGAAGPAFAQCTGSCAVAQVTEQEFLLSPFNSLLSSPAGIAVLNTNLATENGIYLNSTQAEKIASGTCTYSSGPSGQYSASGIS